MTKKILISGVDGSGKTTLVNNLQKKLLLKNYKVVKCHIGHSSIFKKNKSHLNKKNLFFNSNLFALIAILFKDLTQIIYYSIKYFNYDYIIFDRYLFDTFVKLKIRNNFFPLIIFKISNVLVPNSPLKFFLCAQPNITFNRDKDFSKNYHLKKFKIYNQINNDLNLQYIKINANNKPAEVFNDVYSHIKRKKIIFLNYYLSPMGRGGGVVSKELISRLMRYNYDVLFIGHFDNKTAYKYQNTYLYQVNYKFSEPILFPLFCLLKYFYLTQYASFFIGNHIAHWPWLFFRKKNIRQYITIVHNTYLQRYKAKKKNLFFRATYSVLVNLENFVHNKSDKIVVISKNTHSYLNLNYESKIFLIENGVDTSFHKPRYIKSKKFSFCFIGSLSKRKRIFETLKIFYEFNKIYRNSSFYIVGSGSEQKKIIKYINEKEINSNVFLTGQIQNVEKVYQKSNCLLLLSKGEGLPMVLLEAISSGLSVIVTKEASGNSKLVINGFNGFVVDNNLNTLEIISAMKTCIENDLRYRKNSRKLVLDYDWNNVIKKYIKLIKDY